MKQLLSLILLALLGGNLLAAPISVSGPAQSSVSAAGSSFNPAFSADGERLIFVSHANNLVTNDDLGLSLDVFVRDLAASNTVLVSVSTNGFGGANVDANYPSVSSNGQFIAFASRASNLVFGDTNGASDIFLRDIVNGTTRLVSVDVNGGSPVDPDPTKNIPLSGYPQISADGRWVFFESRATNLLAAPAPLGSVNIYGRDTWSNVTVLVSIGTNSEPVSGTCTLAGITPDTRFAAFTATNQALVDGVTNAGPEVYVRNLQNASTIWASSNMSALLGGAYRCSYPVLAAAGNVVAFNGTLIGSQSTSPFTLDLASGVTTRLIAIPISNAPPVLSADGSIVAFESGSNGWTQIYVWNSAVGSASIVHQRIFGNYPQSPTHVDGLSGDGRYVAFRELGGPFFTNGFVARYQLFRLDLGSGTVELVSASTNSGASRGSFDFSAFALSPDGSITAFDSTETDLVAGDRNGASDIFLRDMSAGITELISKAHPQEPTATALSLARLGLNSISADARRVVFTRYDDPSAYRDTNGWSDVFLSDLQSGSVMALSIDTNLFANPGGPGPVTNTAPNTNHYAAPIISANGSTIAALRQRAGNFAGASPPHDHVVARASNGVFTTGMRPASIDVNGASAPVESASLSADGDLLAFATPSQMMWWPNDANNASDVFVLYFQTRAITNYFTTNYQFIATNYLISRSTNYTTGSGASTNPVLSLDGRWLAFQSLASDIVPGNSAAFTTMQLVVADLGTDRADTNHLEAFTNHLASYTIAPAPFLYQSAELTNWYTNTALMPLTVPVTNAALTANSRYVVFGLADQSAIYRHDLFATHTNIVRTGFSPDPPHWPIYVTNMVAGAENTLICTNCRNPSVSADGNVVAYERARAGSSLVDLFAKDLQTGEEILISIDSSGGLPNGTSSSPLVSADGRYVVFQSRASDLVAIDTNGVMDVLVRDRLLGATMLVSANALGISGNGPSSRPVIAPDGRTVVFQSFANDFIARDFNDKRDIFVLKLAGADTDGDGMDDDWEVAHFSNLLRNGSGDFDSDGQTDLQEFLAGTDPTNGNSIFRVLAISAVGGSGTTVFWIGSPNRSYRVEYKDDLNSVTWSVLSGSVAWNGSTASLIDTNASTARFYRVVRLP